MSKIQKFLYRPVSPFRITQGFHENSVCISKTDSKDIIRCNGFVPPEGYRSIYNKGHGAIDLAAKRFTPIYSSQDGTVTELVDEERRGLGLGITTDKPFYCKETDSFEHFKVRYWHNYAHKVRLGDEVKIGDLIAWADNTGFSSGDHVHFDLKPVEISYNRDGTIRKTTNILQNNGYYGSVDPEQYLLDKPAAKLQGIKSFKDRLLWAMMNTR